MVMVRITKHADLSPRLSGFFCRKKKDTSIPDNVLKTDSKGVFSPKLFNFIFNSIIILEDNNYITCRAAHNCIVSLLFVNM